MGYFLFILPAMLLGMWAQSRVKSAYAAASDVPASSRLSGLATAQAILEAEGISNVGIEQVSGKLSDHYDPRAKMLRLSEDVYSGSSLASLGIAAHEVGHAIQDHISYKPLVIRNRIVPLASTGSRMSFFVIMAGGLLNMFNLIIVGIALFSLTVIFQLVNLPVEFDASKRAKQILLSKSMITAEEHKTVDKVLDAAAMTYVAATISSIGTLLYYIMRYAGNRR